MPVTYAPWPASTAAHADAVLDALRAGGVPGYAQLAAPRGRERCATAWRRLPS